VSSLNPSILYLRDAGSAKMNTLEYLYLGVGGESRGSSAAVASQVASQVDADSYVR
jgi:hypothetical protein